MAALSVNVEPDGGVPACAAPSPHEACATEPSPPRGEPSPSADAPMRFKDLDTGRQLTVRQV